MKIKKNILIKVRISFMLILVCAILIILRIGKIQFVEGEKWKSISQKSSFQYRPIKAQRGNIYSDNGSLLATSLPFYRVAFDATIVSDKTFDNEIDSLSICLSKFFKDNNQKIYKKKLQNARQKEKKYIRIGNKMINYHDKKKLEKWPIFRYGRLKGGVIFEKVNKRFKPFNNLSNRTIGYINKNGRGAGLEYSFNKVLAGVDGEALFHRLAGGNWKKIIDGSEIKSEEGLDIQTTIDINLQDLSETSLLKALENHAADYGIVVVMEVETGKIKAISNLSRNYKGYYYEKYNYAVGGLHEPGSTFKLATMMALFDHTNLKLNDIIDTGNGTLMFYDNMVKDHHDVGYGKITVKHAFEISSNVAMAKMVTQYYGKNPDIFIKKLKEIGLTKPLGLQIKGEGVPKIKTPNDNNWSGITLPWMAYGYGLEITPLQILTLYNAIANNGVMVKPMFVTKITSIDETIENINPKIINEKICKKSTLAKLQLMLEGVVNSGTVQNIKNIHYQIAGKTGTSQILENGKYTKKYITSFVGYFPANRPKYSMLVLIKNPKGVHQYGGNVAAPVFKEIADNIYAKDFEMNNASFANVPDKKGIFPVIRSGKKSNLSLICNELGISNHSESDDEWVQTKISGNSIIWEKNTLNDKLIPNVMGMTLRDALYLLESKGLKVSIKGSGRVANQQPSSGSTVSKDQHIFLMLH